MDPNETGSDASALFGPPTPSLRSYLALLASRAWKRRRSALRDAVVAVVLVAVTTWWQVRKGIVKGGDLAEIVVTTALPVFTIVLVYFLWEFIWTAYRIHQFQARQLRTKQALLDCEIDERARERTAMRESSARRIAALRERQRRDGVDPPHPKAHLSAKVRLKGEMLRNIKIANDGELEAQHVLFDPITDEGFPWQLALDEVGTLPPVQGHDVTMYGAIERRPGVSCDHCIERPPDLSPFFRSMAGHHALHEERERIDHSVPVTIRYDDELRRAIVVTYRLDIRFRKSVRRTSFNVVAVYADQSDPTRR